MAQRKRFRGEEIEHMCLRIDQVVDQLNKIEERGDHIAFIAATSGNRIIVIIDDEAPRAMRRPLEDFPA